MSKIQPRKFLPSTLSIAIAAVLSATMAPAVASDPIKRLLDLQLKKGIITQEEYDDFMQVSVADSALNSSPERPTPSQPNNKTSWINTVADQPADPDDFGTTIINNDNIKVDVFGTVDLAVGYTSKSLVPSGEMPTTIGPWITSGVKIPTATPSSMSSQTGLFNGALSSSAWGIKASRRIGPDGLKAFVLLDSAFNPATGQLIDQTHNQSANGGKYPTTVYATSALNGQMFSREAYVGLSSNIWGKITFGRNNNLIQDVLTAYAPLQKASLLTPFGNGVLGGGGGVSENSRVDYSIKYLHKMGDINFGLLQGLGGVGGLRNGAAGTAGNLGYDNGTLGVQFIYEQFKDLLKTATTGCFDAACNTPNPTNQISLTAYDQSAFLLAMKYKINNKTRIQLGLQRTKLTAPASDSNIAHLQSIYDQVVYASTSYNGTPTKMTISHLGIDHDLNEKWNIGAAYIYADMPAWTGFTNAHATQANGGLNLPSSSTSFSGGGLESLTFLTIYRLYKDTDLYGGLLFTHYTGTAFSDPTKYVQSITTAATGLRFKF